MTEENRRLKSMMEVQQQLMLADFDLPSFMQTVCDHMCLLTGASGSTIEMLEDQDMVYAAVSGTLSPHFGIRINKDASLSGLCVTLNQILYSAETQLDDRVNKEATARVGARSMVCVPLVEAGRSVGVLKVIAGEPNAFSTRDIETLQWLSFALGAELRKQIDYDEKLRILNEYEKLFHQLRSEIDRREQLEQELIHLTEHDALTGLLDRRGFAKHLQIWLKESELGTGRFGLYYLDLNGFKKINDTYGHEVGDLILKAFAGRMKQAVGESDLVARFGGDEFVLAVRMPESDDDRLQEIAERLIRQLEEPMQHRDLRIPMRTSVGCTMWTPGKSEAELIRNADHSMYVAKSAEGTNRIAIDHELIDTMPFS